VLSTREVINVLRLTDDEAIKLHKALEAVLSNRENDAQRRLVAEFTLILKTT
jgi:hypothetical protein